MMSDAAPNQQEVLNLLNRTPGKRPQFFAADGMDQMFSMIIELSSQLYVVKERLYAHEAILGDMDIQLADTIDRWEPSEAQAKELQAMRGAMIDNLFRTVTARDPKSAMPPETDDPNPPI